MEFAFILFLAAGLLIGYIIAHFRRQSLQPMSASEVRQLQQNYNESQQTTTRQEERIQSLKEQLNESERNRKKREQQAAEYERKWVRISTENKNLQQRLERQQKESQKLQTHFKEEFENLATRIFEEKSQKFTRQNEENLDQLLKPLAEKIESFKQKVEESHKEDIKGRSALGQHLKQLKELNQQMNEEAQNLTEALKGDTQAQGAWGEVILERILEQSGLTKNREYDVQVSARDADQKLQRPDAVIYLPDDKFMVIDSKVSLNAYERLVSADEDEEKKRRLKAHIRSVRSHVDGLSQKNYQQLFEDRTPDFVLMFIPIESAFGAAFQADSRLYNYAFKKNIVIVSPSTLLATLATINNVWKREYQSQNARKIADRGGKLYDKFVLFVKSLEKVGDRIRQSQESYATALGRLKEGRGNLIGQADKLRKLGAANSKRLPTNLVDAQAYEESEPSESDGRE